MTLQPTRIQPLADLPPNPEGAYVLYWMQQSQRAAFNPALEYAVAQANELDLPVLVAFGLTDGYPEANARHYAFMLEGLASTAAALRARGIGFTIRRGSPERVALELARDAALVVCDRGYLRHQKAWRTAVAREAGRRVVQVEGDVVVPVETASGKHEVGARTLRPKLYRLWDEYLVDLPDTPLRRRCTGEPASTIDVADLPATLAGLAVDHDVRPVRRFPGGTEAGLARFRRFLDDSLLGYGKNRSVPEAGAGSHMSPYLHFGQVSPVQLALMVREAERGEDQDRSAYLEELIVRRELAMNHCHYEPRYDAYEGVPAWARKTLDAHRDDPRPHLYSRAQLEAGETHDRYWNGAMKEMRETGYMHNHMRMYWGKKILEWSPSPEEAFAVTLAINNKYFLDGRDANSYTNVSWIYGLHDRPWFGRQIFGNVRYMSENGLKKFDLEAYLRTVDRLAEAEGG